MSAQFFDELQIPEPDYHLGCGSAAHGAQTARMLEAIENVLLKERFDCVVVYGDTNSTLAGALAAAKLQIPVAHVEAGLRSFNRTMPEEINRVVTDHISNRLFCPTQSACVNLCHEGIVDGVEFVGDVMYDLLLQVRPQLMARTEQLLKNLHLVPQDYIVATVHRVANTESLEAMQGIAEGLNKLNMPVLFPVHPRTRAYLDRYGIFWNKNIRITEPLGYFDLMALGQNAHRIITDSGGFQKEAFFLGIPCVTLRDETEWTETVELGWNTLVGTRWQDILNAIEKPTPERPRGNPFGKGTAGIRIAQSWTV